MSITPRLLAVLATAAAGAETALALAGGLPAAGTTAVVIAAAAVLTARYTAGHDAQDNARRAPLRLLEERRAGLGDWHRVVEQGLAGQGDDAQVLRRRLQWLYAARLAERHAVSLYDRPEAAAALVGPEAWSLIDPARPASPEAVPAPVLRAAVDRLTRL
ncbi:hypothetical protein [Kitasatospora aureofaciens]|uniref:hypothetical protein n=1 Tax=Kitasatospora aureofaciens TaxID=1894 RepID=UPI001C462CCC|nr:hypothetical protein [Kitasatospora aureofaciens]MBV6702919.1 hypothetical protein [Kitasatospora aureofaciens]